MNKIEGQIRIPSGCAIAAVISREGQLMTGETIIESMKPMHDRSNGLGGGFAAYGIYPEYRDFFALHMFLDDRAARKNCEAFLRETMEIVREERISMALSATTPTPVLPEQRGSLASATIPARAGSTRIFMTTVKTPSYRSPPDGSAYISGI